MNSLTKIILLIASTLIAGQIVEYEERKLPDHIKAWYLNKTDTELAYEDCLSSWTLCKTFQRAKKDTSVRKDPDNQICAMDKTTSGKGTFNSLCDMIYENCKNDVGIWGYFHDGPCVVEFISNAAADPDAHAVPAAPTVPDAPVVPKPPVVPDSSAVPDTPTVPDASAVPNAPAILDDPAVPDAPAVSDAPTVPGASADPSAPAEPGAPVDPNQ